MNNVRILSLIQFIKDDPNDQFSIYALALEYLNKDNLKSEELFKELLEKHPQYLPTYFHAASLFSDLGKREIADQTYKKGIELATAANNDHALRELKSAYLNFQFED
ncbi:MAG: Tfp pilus assembly protein PilF [Marinoscillum sp.]|jgi:Tfp pilus assembly protein PilF